jgi:hypothetical protein
MIPPVLHTFIDKLAADGRVSQEEALEARRLVFTDGKVARAEADMLFMLNERVGGDDPAWAALFVEAIGDHLMQTGEPEGHVSEEGARWFAAAIGRDGSLERETELAALLKVLDRAESVPASLVSLARDLVYRAVVTGKGYVGRDAALVPGQIGETELALIKSMLYAAAGAGDVYVTREEAEWLFSIDAATEGRAHCPGWRDVFVNAVMNHLFAAGPSAMLGRDQMVARANWMNEKSAGIGAFYARIFKGGVKGFADRLAQPGALADEAARADARESQANAAEALDLGEAAWLVARINADKRKTANERALIEAVKAAKGEGALKSA